MYFLSKAKQSVLLLQRQLSFTLSKQKCELWRQLGNTPSSWEANVKSNRGITFHKDHVEIFDSGPVALRFPYFWLRDHCRCSQCYNTATHQRNFDLLSIPFSIHPLSSKVVEGNLQLQWPDGHVSTYSLSWLLNQNHPAYEKKATSVTRLMWRTPPEAIAHVPLNSFLHSSEGLCELMKSLVTYGVGFVEGSDPTVEATEQIIRRVGPPMRTLFGDVWEMKPSVNHEDTAYSSQALGAHTDNTYFTEAAGLQIFHVLKHEGLGGNTLLVDGFRAALDVKLENEEYYNNLSSRSIPSEYLEPNQHHLLVAPVLRLHPLTRELQQIRFNLYDRASLTTLPYEQVMDWYRAVAALALAVRDPAGEYWLRLRPGQILFVDNWRVLHGRSAFSGLRWVTGAYISRTDYLSCARVSGALASDL